VTPLGTSRWMIGRTHRVGRGEMENGDTEIVRLTKVYGNRWEESWENKTEYWEMGEICALKG
jgi:hypothetical protein